MKKYILKSNYQAGLVGDRDGNPSSYHHLYVDEENFTINPKLMKELKLETCPEKTPEGKALWLYVRLCQLLKYDETYYFNDTRKNPNHRIDESFQIVGDVTAETPTTCFNFSRIAVKLLNRIPGVRAAMIGIGNAELPFQHLRFAYCTDRVKVDAEPTGPINHFNDLTLVKLGLAPEGLKFNEGEALMESIAPRIYDSMLASTREYYQDYLTCLRQQPTEQKPKTFAIVPLVAAAKKYGLDGNSLVQVLHNLKHQVEQSPFDKMLRVGLVTETGEIMPQLLLRKKFELTKIDLTQMEVHNLPVETYFTNLKQGILVRPDLVTDDPSDMNRVTNDSASFSLGWDLYKMQSNMGMSDNKSL